jgi:NAD-dependent deacetylase
MKKLVVLTGAGMSAESGISTFRDSDGLWEKHRIEDVATPEGWFHNPQLVLDFYNARRKQLLTVKPNKGHILLHELEKNFDVHIVTQNVDNLHEQADSSKVLHLHGELMKLRSTGERAEVYEIDIYADKKKSLKLQSSRRASAEMKVAIEREQRPNEFGLCRAENLEISIGDLCPKGHQLRPHIVWFGEAVPELENAIEIVKQADILLIIGTSLQVYPAAGLMHYSPAGCPIYYIDPKGIEHLPSNIHFIKKGASEGLQEFCENCV